MKKLLFRLVFLLLAISLISGCNNESIDGENKEIEQITFATSIQSGNWYPLGGALGNLINNHTDIDIAVIPSNGTEDNSRLMKNGEAQMALMMGSFAYDAYRGLDDHADDPMENLRTFIMSEPIYMNFIV